jgi:hypothetical protein
VDSQLLSQIKAKYEEFRKQIQETMSSVPKRGTPSPLPLDDGPSEDPCIEQLNAATEHMAKLDRFMGPWSIEMGELLDILQDCRDLHPEYVPPIQIDP